jgi:hypothetical protein
VSMQGPSFGRWEAAACGSRRPRSSSVFRGGVSVRGYRLLPEPPQVGSGRYLDHQDLPGADGGRNDRAAVRTDRGRALQGSMEVTEYEPVSSSTVVSRIGPFRLQARTMLAPVAPASTRLELVIDTRARGVIGLLLPLMRGRLRKTMLRSLRRIKEQVEATASPMT